MYILQKMHDKPGVQRLLKMRLTYELIVRAQDEFRTYKSESSSAAAMRLSSDVLDDDDAKVRAGIAVGCETLNSASAIG